MSGFSATKFSLIAAFVLTGNAALAYVEVGANIDVESSAASQIESDTGTGGSPAFQQLAALSPEERERMRSQIREHWQQASPEERQKMRDEAHERWQQLPPEERQRRREEMRERWQQMSPEQRQNIREAIREHHGGDGPGPGPGGGPGHR